MGQRKKNVLDLENVYNEMQTNVCREFDDIMASINRAWDSAGSEEYMQRLHIISKMLDDTTAEIKMLYEKLREKERHRPMENEIKELVSERKDDVL